MQHGFIATRIQLEEGAVGSAAIKSGAVKVACGVPNQTRVGAFTICPTEAVQHSFVAIRIQLKDRSSIGGAPEDRSTVEVSRRVPEQTCRGLSSVHPTSDGVQQGNFTGRTRLQLKNCS